MVEQTIEQTQQQIFKDQTKRLRIVKRRNGNHIYPFTCNNDGFEIQRKRRLGVNMDRYDLDLNFNRDFEIIFDRPIPNAFETSKMITKALILNGVILRENEDGRCQTFILQQNQLQTLTECYQAIYIRRQNINVNTTQNEINQIIQLIVNENILQNQDDEEEDFDDINQAADM